jgi:hypothetical protein
MTPAPIRPRALARPLLLMAAAVALLSACNPLTAPLPGSGLSLIVQYSGPTGAWYELSLSGFAGYDVDVSVSAYASEPHERLCRDAASGQVEPCIGYPGLVNQADPFVGSATYRAVISPLNFDWLINQITCRQGATNVPCPSSLRVSMRVVDAQGTPVGDLTTSS